MMCCVVSHTEAACLLEDIEEGVSICLFSSKIWIDYNEACKLELAADLIDAADS